jgi:hypothetical protein
MGTDTVYRVEMQHGETWTLWATYLYEAMAHDACARVRVYDHVTARVVSTPRT